MSHFCCPVCFCHGLFQHAHIRFCFLCCLSNSIKAILRKVFHATGLSLYVREAITKPISTGNGSTYPFTYFARDFSERKKPLVASADRRINL